MFGGVNTSRIALNDLVERCLDGDRDWDSSPVFSRNEARQMVLQALKIGQELAPDRAAWDDDEHSLVWIYRPDGRTLNRDALRVAEIELDRGFRGA